MRFLLLVALGSMILAGSTEDGVATTQQDLLRRVDVTITDSAIEIRRRVEPTALIRGSIGDFRVVNRSSKPRNFVVGVDRTPVLAPGESARFHSDISLRGQLPYRVTVNCAPGLKGEFQVY